MENDSDQEQCTPSNIKDLAKNAVNNLLPKKSKDRYEQVYKKFMTWRQKNNINSFRKMFFWHIFKNYPLK